MLNKQRELTAQINEKKERARSAINISTGTKTQSQTSQSKMFLQKIKR